MLLYSFLALVSVLLIYSNFFADSSIVSLLEDTKIYYIAVVIVSVTVIGIIVFIAERIIRKNTKHIFFIYFLCFSTMLIVFNIFDVALFRGIYFIGSIPLIILTILFVYKLLWKTSGEIQRKMILVVIGSGLFILIFTQMVILILRNEFELVLRMKALILIASVLLGYGFYTIPSFTEFDWDKKIRHLYILNKNGLCILQQPFKRKSLADEDLFGGSLIGIQSLIGEIIQSDKALKVIDHADAKIIFEQSPNAIAIMVSDEDLYVVHFKLQQLLKEFDLLFGPLMISWNGDLSLFKPLQPIIKKIFEIKEE
jgi:hypothetical protein